MIRRQSLDGQWEALNQALHDSCEPLKYVRAHCLILRPHPSSIDDIFFFQAEDGIRYYKVTGVQTCALPIFAKTPAFSNGIERLLHGVSKYRLALLCSERDPLTCHRTVLVCRHLRGKGFDIEHIDRKSVV